MMERVRQRLSSLQGKRYSLSSEGEGRILLMGENFAEVWDSERCPATLKKMLFRTGYVFRIATANSRLESIEEGKVRFRYTDHRSHQIRHVTLSAIEFIHRFLEHVLPRGTTKVRYYGIFSPSSKSQLECARQLLPPHSELAQTHSFPQVADPENEISTRGHGPLCRIGLLVLFQNLPAQRTHSP